MYKGTLPDERVIDLMAKPVPKLRIVGNAPTREEFEAWQDHPISKAVFVGLEINADECREEWAKASWDKGGADQLLLAELRTRSDALLSLVDATYEDWCSLMGWEPKE